MRHSRRTLTVLLGLTLALAACADPGADVGDDPNAPELKASCGAVQFDDPSAPLPSTPLNEDAEAAIASVYEVAEGEAQFFEEYEWYIAESDGDRLVLFGDAIGEQPEGAPPYADASFVKEGDNWKPQGWGQCRIDVSAEGFGNAHWVLDPDKPAPTASSTELSILINERACANGEAPEGRQIVTQVLEADDRLMITVLVEPVSGNATCPSNPWHPMTVELEKPLGDRALYDGSTVPALERTWPPSKSSLEWFGSQE